MIQGEELLISLGQRCSASPFPFLPPYPSVSEAALGTMINQPKPVITQYIKGFAYYSADQPTMDDFICNH